MLGMTRIAGIEIDDRYFTGLLLGDAIHFYSVTWHTWRIQ